MKNIDEEKTQPLEIVRDVALGPLTTLGIGGRARYFWCVHTREQISLAVQWARREGITLFVLGGGSNLLIADEGFNGLVLQMAIRGVETQADGDGIRLKAAAGEPWDELVAQTTARHWAGLECLSGIPGLVGATPIQNVGAYGQEVGQTIVAVEVYDLHTDAVVVLSNQECRFRYRDSLFKREQRNRYIILAVHFRLTPDGKPNLTYSELQKYMNEQKIAPSLVTVRQAVLAIRRRKGMVVDPLDPDSRSAGSFFLNPILSPAQYRDFEGLVQQRGWVRTGEHLPTFAQENGTVKLAAAWLIERAGLAKGFCHGQVGISNKHALALINRGGGTAKELLELTQLIQRKVKETFGVELLPETEFVGFASSGQ